MKYKGTLLAVSDMDASRKFYFDTLGLRVVADFGANVTLTGGVSLQTIETWNQLIRRKAAPGAQSTELYFEEDDFDAFAARLANMPGIEYVHPTEEQPWGQRGVRIFDPDGYIIEIGENMAAVCARFLAQGMTETEVAARMDVPEKCVRIWRRQRERKQ